MYFGKKQIEDCIRIIGLKELLVLWVYSVWDDTKHNSVSTVFCDSDEIFMSSTGLF